MQKAKGFSFDRAIRRATVLVLTMALGCAEVFAWGATGHRVVGRIAENHLSLGTQQALEEILGSESLVEASTWADWIRSDPAMNHAGPWHYINIPDGETYASSRKNPEGDAYVILNQSIETVMDSGASKAEKLEAIRWISHLVADLHQPLHVGRAEDRGGNSIRGEWFGESTNAHRLWDSQLIEYTDLSFSELAESIDRRVQVEIESGSEPEPMQWIEESMLYRKRAYTMPESSIGGSYRYAYENLALVEQRLKQAGLRLALTLEYALGNSEEWAGMSNGVHWMRNAAEYEALTRQIFANARRELEERFTSGELDGKSWGVSLDADETVLDNSLYAKELHGSSYDPESWDEWCRRMEAPAIPGSVEFIRFVKEIGGTVAIVSNRTVQTQKETETNLKALGVEFDVVLLKDETSDKHPRWKLLEEGKAKAGLDAIEILLYLGDNIHDFPDLNQGIEGEAGFARFGRDYFVFPNPSYGSWERLPKH